MRRRGRSRPLDSYKSTTEAELAALRAHRDRTKDPKPEIEELKRQIVQLDIRKGHAEYQRDESKKVLKIRTDLYKYYDWCNSRRILDLPLRRGRSRFCNNSRWDLQ